VLKAEVFLLSNLYFICSLCSRLSSYSDLYSSE